MNLSIFDELELISKELRRYMSPNAVKRFARKIEFVQSRSKYDVQELITLCV
ncbi:MULTISPECIES: hypothetical protein [Bacillus cereus group]|uniref:hypothetical protein n=1 Tax=Bacillus cereus group TaxID=86661 RepID=UPI000A9DF8C7|nr:MULTISPECIES: hypothetical protein [Bacillus cereus group]MDA2770828.1 hypothetical protein [Bacillus cereus group sp. Bc010]MED1446597.1 hypothetical protein [Bacillus pacificus]MED1648612.1 hypothetical protein [Bacillus pacificus]HDR7253822.1 hypothetical protein [Bacillus pacificus]HDR7484302.1 hypothetical protein [Bacillus pacificus]